MQQVQTTLPTGSIVGERYQVEALLGKGGFGAVYLVRDLRVRQNVFALKEVIDPDQRERRHFTFEADVLKRTDHPSLPRVYRAFEAPSQDRAYMLMDYIEGTNLEKLRRQQPAQIFPLSQALTLLRPIVEAITYLHTLQPPIIHRDIKPSNIIAPGSDTRTILVDFGIAKEVDQEATTTVIRHATPGYGAPEQYGTGTDIRTDIYGLAATLYTLLTGTVPTDAFYRMTQQMSKHVDPLLPARQLVPTIPEHVSQAIAQAMSLDKNKRFATAKDFWAVLEAETPTASMLASEQDQRHVLPAPDFNWLPYSTPAPTSKPSHARSRWPLLALLLLLALGVGFAAAFFSLAALRSQQAASPTTGPGAHATSTTPIATPSSQPTPTPTAQTPPTASPASALPALHSAYTGNIHDNHGDIDTKMMLQQITQEGQDIQGNFLVSLPLTGNGPFTGTVNTSSFIQFTVHSSTASAPLFFSGKIHSDGTINGQYCSLDRAGKCNPNFGGYGTWSVSPNDSTS